MDQLTSSLLALNVDGQQRLPFQPRSAVDKWDQMVPHSSAALLRVDAQYNIPRSAFNAPFNLLIKSVVASEFIPTYPVKNNAQFSLAPMTFTEIPNCLPASANQLPANPQMEVEEEDEMMLPAAAAAATAAKSQATVRRSERLANKPRLNYKEVAINK